jgi:hypothetical protein
MLELGWSHGHAVLSPTAAMLIGAELRLPSGWFSPFAEATWTEADPAVAGLPGHLRVLGGEFVCVPFGSAPVPSQPASGWEGFNGVSENAPPHGPSADNDWRIERAGSDSVTFALDYPEDSPVKRLERTVEGLNGRAKLGFTLTIHARRPEAVPVGLHPIFRMPATPGGLHVAAEFTTGFSYPGPLKSASARPGTVFADLASAAEDADLSRLPLGRPVEDVLLLGGATGPVRLSYPHEAAAVELDWDRALLPSVMLWIADRALESSPWNGSYRGLGVEPIAAAFDLPSGVSTASNPLTARGIATTVSLDPAHPVVIRSSISASQLV